MIARLAVVASCLPLAAAQEPALPSIESRTQGLAKHDGLLPFWLDARAGKVWLEVPRPGDEFLYADMLVTGLGSNPVGLDRGKLGRERLVRFERVGARLLLVERNVRFRAQTDDPHQKRAVDESFASSVLWGGEVAAETAGRVLADVTSLVVRDACGVARALRAADEGEFRLDAARSTPWPAACKAFPNNIELEALLTFASDRPGAQVRAHAPHPEAWTVRVRHSFLALPEPGYRPRAFDPRAGANALAFADYAAPLEAPLEQRWIVRHRLEKRDPQAAVSEAVRPIVYYVDRGAPEPVRSALVEGARWWAAAFEAAGFENAFRVELLPEDADPLDARYHVIQWVHRSTRGWSYGRTITDPRTGEILKGHVTLGSLRVRQDRLLFEGLRPVADGCCAAGAGPDALDFAGFDPKTTPVEVALARIRQLAAHEVGHTLGFAHNFAASACGRASVMDYPAPFVKLTEAGDVDLSDAYARGIGEWDKVAVRCAYAVPRPGEDEAAMVEAILREARQCGLLFLTDADARAPGTAHPLASLWDNGEDAVRELERVMNVRSVTLGKFGLPNLAKGRPLGELEATFVPLFLQHRYQVAAAAKLLGGVTYEHWLHDGEAHGPRPVPPVRQQRALETLLATLDPQVLLVPDAALDLLNPADWAASDRSERLPRRTGPTFDWIEAAAACVDLTLAALLHPERCARLVEQRARDKRLPGLVEVLTALREAAMHREEDQTKTSARGVAARRVVQRLLVGRLLDLAADPEASSEVRVLVAGFLQEGIRGYFGEGPGTESHWQGREIDDAIARFRSRPHAADRPPARPRTPPGEPIGQ